MIRLRKHCEQTSDGKKTGRIVYSISNDLPATDSGCSWQVDENFKIDDDLTHDPEKLYHYGKALTEGFVIVEDRTLKG